MSRADYFARWAELHGGYDPVTGGRAVRWWLTVVHLVASPLARWRVAPGVITMLGGLLALAAVGGAVAGGPWLVVASVLVALSGLVDGLDGAVAVMTSRTTAWGAVLDSVVDRVSDGLYVLALYVVGAPAWLCVLAAALTALHEYLRARATAGGMSDLGVVTVSERPTRVIVTAMFLLGAGIFGASADSWATADAWATAGAAAWAGLGAIGLAQLLVVVRRRLTRS